MPIIAKPLGQVSGSSAAQALYTEAGGQRTLLKTVLACNTKKKPVAISIYDDEFNQGFSSSNALVNDLILAPKQTFSLEINIVTGVSNAQIGVKGAGVTFTGYGAVQTLPLGG